MNTTAVDLHDVASSKSMLWASWILTAACVLIFLWSGWAKLTHQAGYVHEWERLGYPDSELTKMALLQLTCLALYLIPRTSVLGMVLLTGYLGGAVASYVRIGHGDFAGTLFANAFEVTTALFGWGGLYLREKRLWALLPVRRTPA